MTTKNCANSPKLVLTDMCKKSVVWNVQLLCKLVCQYLWDFNLILHSITSDVCLNILSGPNAFVTEKWHKNSEELSRFSFQVFWFGPPIFLNHQFLFCSFISTFSFVLPILSHFILLVSCLSFPFRLYDIFPFCCHVQDVLAPYAHSFDRCVLVYNAFINVFQKSTWSSTSSKTSPIHQSAKYKSC